MLAVAVNVLWPLLANARPADIPSLTEICTTLGVQGVPGDAGVPGSDPAPQYHQPHCPLCAFGFDKFAAPPATLWQIGAIEATHRGLLLPPTPPQAPDALRSPAQPRAPPSLF